MGGGRHPFYLFDESAIDFHSARIPIAARVWTDFFVVLGFGKDGCREHFLDDGLDLSDQSGLLPHEIIEESCVVFIFRTDCLAEFFDSPLRPGWFLFQEAQVNLSPCSDLKCPGLSIPNSSLSLTTFSHVRVWSKLIFVGTVDVLGQGIGIGSHRNRQPFRQVW